MSEQLKHSAGARTYLEVEGEEVAGDELGHEEEGPEPGGRDVEGGVQQGQEDAPAGPEDLGAHHLHPLRGADRVDTDRAVLLAVSAASEGGDESGLRLVQRVGERWRGWSD